MRDFGGGGSAPMQPMIQSYIIENGITYTNDQWTQKLILEKLTEIEKHLAALVKAINT